MHRGVEEGMTILSVCSGHSSYLILTIALQVDPCSPILHMKQQKLRWWTLVP